MNSAQNKALLSKIEQTVIGIEIKAEIFDKSGLFEESAAISAEKAIIEAFLVKAAASARKSESKWFL